MLDGLAARMAAEHGAKRAAKEGPAFLAAGRTAIASGVLERTDRSRHEVSRLPVRTVRQPADRSRPPSRIGPICGGSWAKYCAAI